MADKARVIMKDGTEMIVSGKDFDPVKYEGCELRCAGKIRGKRCQACVEAAKNPKREGFYFRVIKERGNEHMAHCPYDETVDYELAKHLDVKGTDTSIEKIYIKLSKESISEKKGLDKSEKGRSTDEQDDQDIEYDTDKKVIQEKKSPETIKELFEAMSYLGVNGVFGQDGCKVKEHLIYEKTIVTYRKKGIPEDVIMLAVGKVTSPKNYADKVEEMFFTLEDPYEDTNAGRRIFFVLKFRTKAGRKAIMDRIFAKKDKSDYRFLILSKWTKYERGGERYYISESLTKNQVEIVHVDELTKQ